MGLFDMVMIKDNHISIAGGVTNALKSVDLYLEQNNLQMGVEVLHLLNFKLVKCSFFVFMDKSLSPYSGICLWEEAPKDIARICY